MPCPQPYVLAHLVPRILAALSTTAVGLLLLGRGLRRAITEDE